KTHCSHKELHCKQWVMNEGDSLFTQGVYKCKQLVMTARKTLVQTRSYNANNG
ncbi:hypothetical protein KSS87_011871, partial [Heliosperma pusillum]